MRVTLAAGVCTSLDEGFAKITSCGAELVVAQYATAGCNGEAANTVTLPIATCAVLPDSEGSAYYTATCSGAAATSIGVAALLAAVVAVLRAL